MVNEEELAQVATDLMIIVAQHVEAKCGHCTKVLTEAQKKALKHRSVKDDNS